MQTEARNCAACGTPNEAALAAARVSDGSPKGGDAPFSLGGSVHDGAARRETPKIAGTESEPTLSTLQMIVEFETDSLPPGREHPWNVSDANPSWRYHDLRKSPELIDSVIEDYCVFAHHQAVQTFYDLLRWINSEATPFETNDCGLRPPIVDSQPPHIIPFESPTVLHGRLTILFHDKQYNTQQRAALDWLSRNLFSCLRDHTPNFPAVLKIGTWPHLFTEIGKEGNVIALRFWAWGADEQSAFACLNAVFESLTGCLKAIAPLFNVVR